MKESWTQRKRPMLVSDHLLQGPYLSPSQEFQVSVAGTCPLGTLVRSKRLVIGIVIVTTNCLAVVLSTVCDSSGLSLVVLHIGIDWQYTHGTVMLTTALWGRSTRAPVRGQGRAKS